MAAVASGDCLPPGPQAPCDLDRLDDKLGRLQALFEAYGDIYRVRSPSRGADTYVINHPDWVRRVLVSNHRNYTKGVGIDRIRILLGNGIMVSEGGLWRRQRRLIQPAFHRPVIESFLGLMRRAAGEVAACWERHAAEGRPVNITAQMSETTLQVVLQALFGEDLRRLEREQGANPFALVSRESGRDLQFAVKFRALGALVASLLQARRRRRSQPSDLLDLLRHARERSSGEPMSERQLIDEVLTLIVAGHETTAASLNWVWYLLARHPSVAERLRDEADSLVMDDEPGLDALKALAGTEQVIREALRLYPPGWLVTRRAVEADRFGDYRVPAGTDIFICTWLLHRHPRYWREPARFEPGRFAPAEQAARVPFSYLPFSAGPRHCVGEGFAMAEMLIHVALLAGRFRLEPLDERPLELEAGVNLRPARPLWLQPVRYG